MISAVLDPATLLQGLGWRDAPANRVVSAGLAGRYVPVTSRPLLDELERLLRRREIRAVFRRPKRIVELVAAMSLVVETGGRRHPLLEAAAAGGATYLVTIEIPLLQLGTFGDTRIVRPR